MPTAWPLLHSSSHGLRVAGTSLCTVLGQAFPNPGKSPGTSLACRLGPRWLPERLQRLLREHLAPHRTGRCSVEAISCLGMWPPGCRDPTLETSLGPRANLGRFPLTHVFKGVRRPVWQGGVCPGNTPASLSGEGGGLLGAQVLPSSAPDL